MPNIPARIGQIMRLSLAGAALLLSGCGPADEFRVPPQQGAWNKGIYPNFNQRPQAETAQFTPDEAAKLTAKLHSAGQRLETASGAEDKAQAAQPTNAAVQEQANKEIQDTLRQIQNGGK